MGISTLVLSLLALSAPAGIVRAQAPELSALRESLASYDLDGDRTTSTLAQLASPPGSRPEVAREARFLRAVVATDLVLAAFLDPGRAALAGRVAAALGVAPDALMAHLRAELEAVRSGVYRGPATEALTALSLRDALERGDTTIAWSGGGERRDLLFLRAAAGAIDGGGLEQLAPDPCASGSCPDLQAQIPPVARRRLAALVEMGAALRRLERSAAGGDALTQAILPIARAQAARADGRVETPPPRVPDTLPIAPGSDAGDPVRPDLVVAISAREIRLARPASYGVRGGAVVALEAGEDVLPASVTVPLPREYRALILPIDEIVEALRARSLPAGAVIAIAAAPDVEAHVIARVMTSAARAERSPSLLVRRAPDGTLRGAAIALADADETGVPGDVTVRVRMGGYGIARARGREQSVPRVRAAAGMVFDLDGLAAALGRIPHRRAILDPMASLPAGDLLDAAFRIAATETVTLALP